MLPKYGMTSLCDQSCSVQPADRNTHTWTDKSLKTEGPMILSNDIFFFKTVIIGGSILILKSISITHFHLDVCMSLSMLQTTLLPTYL